MRVSVIFFGISFFLSVALAEERLLSHGEPTALSDEAQTSNWPRFLGPTDDLRSPETHLFREWGDTGPALLWELSKGEGYASPIIEGERLLLFHRLDGSERIECRRALTGEAMWEHSYEVEYRDRYGYQNGPRGSPVIADGKVYSLGVTSRLTCLDLETGKLDWERDFAADYEIRPSFFGAGSSPLVFDDQLIVMIGASGGPCVVGIDRSTGATLWGAEDEWGASYASPQRMGDKVLVFCGGESRPPHGGLLAIDPNDGGKIVGRFFWRAEKFESVNASTPVVLSDDRVFLTQCYGEGGVLLKLEDSGFSAVWKSENYAVHWMNPVTDDEGKTLFLIDGRHQQNARLVAVDIDSGDELWSTTIEWQGEVKGRPFNFGIQRASLLQVDGATLCLGEMGSLLWLRLDRDKAEVLARYQPFLAPQTWTPPVISRGLLYLMQNEDDNLADGKGPRLRCYDLRRR